tara:strand:- start:6743 stop:7204 length:462 start_codon:yes stop_codon:yes gene_type:complete
VKKVITALSSMSLISTVAMADVITSSRLSIKPTRITTRVVLVDNKENSMRVQVLSVFEKGATDFSNTSKIVLAISQLSEWSTVEASFVLGRSIGLNSAKRVGPGLYQVTFIDADKGTEPQILNIDATKAVSDIKNTQCEEFGTCEITTTVNLK